MCLPAVAGCQLLFSPHRCAHCMHTSPQAMRGSQWTYLAKATIPRACLLHSRGTCSASRGVPRQPTASGCQGAGGQISYVAPRVVVRVHPSLLHPMPHNLAHCMDEIHSAASTVEDLLPCEAHEAFLAHEVRPTVSGLQWLHLALATSPTAAASVTPVAVH